VRLVGYLKGNNGMASIKNGYIQSLSN